MSNFEKNTKSDILQNLIGFIIDLYGTKDTFILCKGKEQQANLFEMRTGIFAELNITDDFCQKVLQKQVLVVLTGGKLQDLHLEISSCNKVLALLLIPIKYNSQVCGILGVAGNGIDSFLSAKKMRLLQKFLALAEIALSKTNQEVCFKQKISFYKEQIQNQEELEEKYYQLFDVSPNAEAIIRGDGTVIEVNPGFTLITGFKQEEIVGRDLLDLGIFHNLNDRKNLIQKLSLCSEIKNQGIMVRTKAGKRLSLKVLIRKVYINARLHYMIIGQDISDLVVAEKLRKSQEEALIISRKQLLTAATMGNIGSFEYDLEKKRFEFSKELYAILGTTEACEGKYISWARYIREFVHQDDVEMFMGENGIQEASKAKEAIFSDLVHRIIRRDGQVRTVFVKREFYKDKEGNFLNLYGSVQDITKQLEDEEARRKQAEIIEHMAYFDNLTNLPNRNKFNIWITDQMNIAKTKKKLAGVVFFLDLDNLKMVNDAYGHNFGDQIIATAGRRLRESMGEKAYIARVGGDAFAVMLPGKYTKKLVEIIAQKVIKNISSRQDCLDISLHITVSIGIACYPKDGKTAEDIMKNAANAMYRAKRDGGNSWRFYTKKMQVEAYKKINLIEGLRYAIERKELSLVYQPQINLVQRGVVGVESLLRWNSSEYGYVSPEVFIPLAEQAGLINTIGKWVLDEACAFAQRLTEKGWQNLSVAVNISAMQIASSNFVETISRSVSEAGIRPTQLEIEITESLLITYMDKAIMKLNQIKAMGFSIALDDFGTGYSSLTYLRKLPIKTLKIDKSFIDMIGEDGLGPIMIGAIINMAKTINMRVVAEGVETEKQLNFLMLNGCDCIQGYLFSKPLTEKALYDFLFNYSSKQN